MLFDNALVARRANLIILAVLPAHLQEVARTSKPPPHALVVSLVGATPLAKIRSLFGTPHAITAGAEATLPLLREAHEDRRAENARRTSALSGGGLVGIRLPDEEVLELAAHGLACNAEAVARLLGGLRAALLDLELPASLATNVRCFRLVP